MTWQEEFLERGRQEGLQKGLQEGRQEAAEAGRRTLQALLLQRFGAVPAAAAAQISHADNDVLLRWIGRVLSAGTVEDVLAG